MAKEILNPDGSLWVPEKNPKIKIFAIDFDGVIVEENLENWVRDAKDFIEIEGATETIKQLQEKDHKFILWTCRNEGNNTLQPALDFLKEHGITPDAVNDNYLGGVQYTTSNKPYADVYLDDRSFPPFPGWEKVRKEFL